MKTILDIELSEEEEEDDDYNPEKEKEVSPLPAGRSVVYQGWNTSQIKVAMKIQFCDNTLTVNHL